MKVTPLEIEGLLKIEPRVFGDSRGFFFESWNDERFQEAGLNFKFVQDNVSRSQKGVLRGLHFQSPTSQGKLVSVLEGEVFDVAVDLRKSSKSFGKWAALTLSSENHTQLYIPPGFAHGFLVTSASALFAYKCTELYISKEEISLLWNDPDIGIRWPISNPTLSEKDLKGIRLKDIPKDRLF